MLLTEKELHQIEGYISLWMKDAQIAMKTGRSKSVISRLFRKFPRESFSSQYAISTRFKSRSRRSSWHPRIPAWWLLECWLIARIKNWDSPEQACGRWRSENGWALSKDTLYKAIYERTPELVKTHFRRKWKTYRDRKKDKALGKYQIQDRKMIDERPEEVDERKVVWHWEWDTVIGKGHKGAIFTLVERTTGYGYAFLLPLWKNAFGMVDAINTFLETIPEALRKTVTFDNGREFAYHAMMKITVYFARPYHSWERWTNENWNGLLREFFPKGTDFSTISQNDVTMAYEKLNSRPRKRLWYIIPKEAFQDELKSCVSV
jgi:IS30 family transposase